MGTTRPSRLERLAWPFALAVAVLPLWVTRELPMVDLPQHSYVCAVLDRLHDPATLYPRQFESRPGTRPYIGYYTGVGLLGRVMSIDLANRIFLSLVIAALPLSVAFLLRSLDRPAWPGLLTVPLAFGDAFGWGFVNFCASLPLLFASLGLWARAIADAPRRVWWLGGLVGCLAAAATTHPAPAFFMALAFPYLMLTTRAPEEATVGGIAGWLRPRVGLLALLAWGALGSAIFAASVALRSRTISLALARGDWPGLLTQRHAEIRPVGESLRALPDLLTNVLRDGSDRLGPITAAIVAMAAIGVARIHPRRGPGAAAPWFERTRPIGLVAIATALYLALPLHLYGFVGDLSPRFAPVLAALAVGLVPTPGDRARVVFVGLAAAVSLATAVPLVRGFRAFDRESAPMRTVIAAVGDRPMIMGLIYDHGSRVARRPVYLHAAATAARAHGGVPNYSLADWPFSPIRHRGAAPPSFHDEWRPDRFDYAGMGPAYDHFLGRGRAPEAVFGERLGGELRVAARAGDWWLVRRRP